MKKENCKIFCIYFKSRLYYSSEEGENILKEIAQIGGTNDYYNSDSLESLCNTFNKISDAIQTNYKLKLNK